MDYTAVALCDAAFWESLTTGEKILAGKDLVQIVATGYFDELIPTKGRHKFESPKTHTFVGIKANLLPPVNSELT